MRVRGEDSRGDLVTALLCAGLYPNVSYHLEKRRLVTSDSKTALIHKLSVNNIHKDPFFSSPYFIFDEKVCIISFETSLSLIILPVLKFLF